MPTRSLKIVELRAENIKRLKAITIRPTDDTVIIGGNNGQGKTSVLDSIMMALGGEKLAPEMPVRLGEEKGEITLDLGEYLVRRYFTAAGTTGLEIKTKDGAKFASPQKMLDGFTGQLSFDPLAFVNMPAAKQTETLKALVGLDFTDLNEKRKALYDERTQVNAVVRQLEGKYVGQPEHEGVPDEEVSAAALNQEIREAQAKNREADETSLVEERTRANHEAQVHQIGEQKLKIGQLRELLAQAEEQLAQMEHREAALAEEHRIASEMVKNAERVDTAPLFTQIEQIEETNRKVRENLALRAGRIEWQNHSDKSADLTKQIEAIDGQKAKLLADANFPVEGLGFDDKGVTFDGIPFDQCSAAEQLRVSTAMAIAMNPTIRVMLIRDGSLLDEQSLALVHELAQKHDCQIWIERVGKGEDCSVIIEDGEVEGEQLKLEVTA